jgi:hypothetical protein
MILKNYQLKEQNFHSKSKDPIQKELMVIFNN